MRAHIRRDAGQPHRGVGLRTVRLERDFTPGRQVFRIYVYITGFPAYDADTMLHWAAVIDQLPEGEV